ncbi:MAG: hypothetical protein ACXADH_10600 [Candidatus Kariarchaeaceae archaeon]|jgi:hypothetical protein
MGAYTDGKTHELIANALSSESDYSSEEWSLDENERRYYDLVNDVSESWYRKIARSGTARKGLYSVEEVDEEVE